MQVLPRMIFGSAIVTAIVAGATPVLAKNLTITLDNASKYNMHYKSASGRTDEYPDEIEKGSSGDIVTTHHDGSGEGSIKYTVGEVSSTDETIYCTVEFKISYIADALADACDGETISKSTDRSSCVLSKTSEFERRVSIGLYIRHRLSVRFLASRDHRVAWAGRKPAQCRSTKQSSTRLRPGLVEVDGQLVAVDGGDVAVAEFLVEDALAGLVDRRAADDALGDQLALDEALLRARPGEIAVAALARLVEAAAGAVLLGPLPAGVE